MEITEDSRKGETLYTVKLLFEMPVSKGSENIKRAIMSASCCFIAEDQMHVRRLIGLKEKPRPAVAVSRLNEEKPGGKVLYRDAGWLQGFPNELREIVNPQKNTVTVNRTYISINTPLGVEGIEFKNGKAKLSEEQVKTLNEALNAKAGEKPAGEKPVEKNDKSGEKDDKPAGDELSNKLQEEIKALKEQLETLNRQQGAETQNVSKATGTPPAENDETKELEEARNFLRTASGRETLCTVGLKI